MALNKNKTTDTQKGLKLFFQPYIYQLTISQEEQKCSLIRKALEKGGVLC